jgi:hypothetical protein
MGQHPPDFCLRTFNVPRSAIGSGSRRPEPAGPMSQLGRIVPFSDNTTIGCSLTHPEMLPRAPSVFEK